MAQRQSTLPARPGGKAALGALRSAQIIISKPVLPAEILSLIMDYLSAEDLISCARMSRRIREMVYDDTRWVRRLHLMGCWSEASARKRAEEARRPSVGANHLRQKSIPPSKDAPLIMFNSPTTPTHPKSPHKGVSVPGEAGADGFSEVSVTAPPDGLTTQATIVDPTLEVLSKLESVRGQARQEYGKAHAVLAPFYKDAGRCKVPTNAKVFRTYRDPEAQARMLGQMVRFAQADIGPGWEERAEKLQEVVKAFGDAVSAEFEDGLRSEDVDGKMRRYAHVLFYLDGGQRALDTFLGQSSVTASPYKLGDANDWLAAGVQAEFLPDEYLAFLRKLAQAMNEQYDIINRSFPMAADIAEPFTRKVAAVIFEPYLTKLFDQLQARDNQEQFVKAVPATYLQNLGFLESIKTAPRMAQSETLGKMIQVIYSRYVDAYLLEELALFRKKADTEVTGWERQLSQQDKSLEAMYMASVNRQADKRDFLSSFKKVVMAPVNILPTINFGGKTATTPSGNADGLNPPSRSASRNSKRDSSMNRWSMQRSDSSASKRHSHSNSRSPSPGAEPPTTELEAKARIMESRLEGIKTLFSLEVALSLVHMAKGSIERAAIFAKHETPFAGAAKNKCETIFVVLLQTLGEGHVRGGFDRAVDHLSKYNPRAVEGRNETQMVAPLVTFLELVNVGDLIQQMLDVFYEQELAATRLTDKMDFLNPTVKAKKKFEQMLDERVAAGLNKSIEVLMAEVEYICATTQSTEDYNPGATNQKLAAAMLSSGGATTIDVSTTNTARWVVELVSGHTRMLTGSTDKQMLDVFNQEVGLRLYAALCKHLKRQRVSVAGAPRLMSDMNHYFGFVQGLKNKDLLLYFRALRELSQIYLIDGANAKELATVIADHDRYSGIFGAEEVLEFAERRADWYVVRPKVERAMYGLGCVVM